MSKLNDFSEIQDDVQIDMDDKEGAMVEQQPSFVEESHKAGFSLNPKDWMEQIKTEWEETKRDGFKLTDKRKVLLRAVFGEGLCTLIFLYVVMGAGVNAIRSNSTADNIVTAFGENFVLGAISTAFVSVAIIYSFADVSGAHFNPAVTFATMVTGKTSIRKGIAYILIQLFASICATALVVGSFPDKTKTFDRYTTLHLLTVKIDERAGTGVAFVMEFILSFILVYVIFATAFDTVDTKNRVTVSDAVAKSTNGKKVIDKSVGRNLTIYTTSGNTKAGFAPIAIGFTLGFLTFVGGSVSGGAFNPARAFGPAIVSGEWDDHWVYWFGDFCGAALAGYVQSIFAHTAVQNSGAVAK